MNFIVGLWSVDTPKATFTSATVGQRIIDLEAAVALLDGHLSTVTFPTSQAIRGIFIAPEYFLAQKDAENIVGSAAVERTITVAERDACVQQLCTLSASYPHILIVPGTIAWKKTFARTHGDTKSTDRRQRGAKHLDYYINLDKQDPLLGLSARQNVKGTVTYYRPSAPVRRDIILGKSDTSESISGNTYDTPAGVRYYIRNTSYVFLKGSVVYKYHKRGDFFESINTTDAVFIPSFKRPVVVLPVTPTHSMSFGFEICLDHNIGMLKRLVREQNIANPDFHIICSAAVSNDTANMCMCDGGYMLHASSNAGYTSVYKKNGLSITDIPEDSSAISKGYSLGYWNIFVSSGASGLLTDVGGALTSYKATKTILASAASKNAYTKLLDLHSKRDEAGLRSHLDWYLGKPGARQPVGAGSQIPKDKRFFNLLNAFKY